MPTYKYQAQLRDGRLVTDTIEAINLNFAIDTLMGQKLKIIEITPVRFDLSKLFARFGKVKRESIVMMTRRLTTLLRSALPLDRSLTVLYEQEEDKHLKPILSAIIHDIRVGSSFSWAISKYPETFDPIYISMIKVGETTGDMGGLCDRLATFLERDLAIRNKARSALSYPIFILALAICIIIGIFVFVFPPLLETFSQMSTDSLPLPTRIMITVVNMGKNPYVLVGLGLAIMYYVIYFRDYIKTPAGRYAYDRIKITAPIFGNINKKMLVANFCRVMGTLLSTGVPMTQGLEVLMDFAENEYFRLSIVTPLYESIKDGQSVSKVVQESGFFPQMVSNMMAVGENTGEMPSMLMRISEFYDKEVAYTLESLLTLIEPIMIGTLGVGVCIVLLSVFLPLYSMIMNMS
ncbi:type II secretion system F family protein [bacterium]|nr:type II secretion system F family protein [bacterium]